MASWQNQRLEKRLKTLSAEDFFYSLSLQFKHRWLWERSNQLDGTIENIVNPAGKIARRLFARLLRKFVYVDRAQSHTHIEIIAHHIKEEWRCNEEVTLIMPVCKKSNAHPDGSSKMVYDLRTALGGWKGNYVLSFFNEDDPRVLSGCDVILCDDFIGSGQTISKRIEALKKKMSLNASIYVVALAGMKEARDTFLNHPHLYSFAPFWLEKGINDQAKERVMLDMETNLSPTYGQNKMRKCSLGYGKAGSLYFNEDYRIPNNVYPIFWWGVLANGHKFKSLFLRP